MSVWDLSIATRKIYAPGGPVFPENEHNGADLNETQKLEPAQLSPA